MPVALSIVTGDGDSVPFVDIDLLLPDTLAAISIGGAVKPARDGVITNVVGLQPVAGTVTPITPTGSGTQYLLIEVNPSTGALSSKTSSSAVPVPDAGFIAVAQQIVPSSVPANLQPSLQGGWQLLNQW